ncbi:MAG: cohesin domain-containing protein [Bryobacteraceae bacterium]|jgi:general secretion pathway protein D
MFHFNRLTAILAILALLGPAFPAEAKTRKGDHLLAEGRAHEARQEYDAAMDCYERALAEDPSDTSYQMAVDKMRFRDSQAHLESGLKMRAAGQLGNALLELQKAYAINPGSAVAAQEIGTTQEMIERERQRVEATGKETPPAERALTPTQAFEQQEQKKIGRMLDVPELRPLNPAPINLKMNNKTKVLFETVCKLAGINLLWDPDYTAPAHDGFNIELDDSTVEQALDYLSVLTKSYWKPLSSNAIFITNDSQAKRRDYEEQVTKVFYLQNTNTTQELQEILNAVRTITDIQKLFPYTAQYAIVARGEADKVALAAKIIHDLDKPKAEVLVDVLVVEVSSTYSRQLSAALMTGGLNMPVSFTGGSTVTASSNTGSGTGSSSTPTGTTLPLSDLHLSSNQWSSTLPSGLLQAVLSDGKTKILQAPQLRSLDGLKATLNIGSREPTATGSYQPGVSGVSVSPLVSTQFQYIDVGVNVGLQPRIHGNGDVTMHVTIDISTVASYVSIGGISEPVIGQRKVEHEIRMREGEVGLVGGLLNTEDDKTVSGVPGLSSIPLLGWLFKGDQTTHNRDEIMIVLIPHIVRRPNITADDLRAIDVGNTSSVKIRYAAQDDGAAATAKPQAEAAAGQPAAQPPAPSPAPYQPQPENPPAPAPAVTAPAAPAGLMPPATAPPLSMRLPQTGGAPAPPETPPAAGGSARVYFTPAQADVAVGASLSVALNLDNATDAANAPMFVQFDPKVLKLTDVEPGNLIGAGPQVVFNKTIHNESGQAAIQLSRQSGAPAPSATSGTLVTLVFQPLAAGSATVTIPSLAVRDSQGKVIATASPQLTVTVK